MKCTQISLSKLVSYLEELDLTQPLLDTGALTVHVGTHPKLGKVVLIDNPAGGNEGSLLIEVSQD